MNKQKRAMLYFYFITLLFSGCGIPKIATRSETKKVPESYSSISDSISSGKLSYRTFFKDSLLIALIDTALNKNQELAIMLQEINVAKYEAMSRKATYLPFLGLKAGTGLEKSARYTRNGAVDYNVPLSNNTAIPDPLTDLSAGISMQWELDIWRKLRNSKKSAVYNYLATSEGKNFMVTHLVSEIAEAYYELIALDNQIEILRQNISIQQNALEIVKLEKLSAKVTELAVRKFEAEVLKNQSQQFAILQDITETENKINFLLGRYPQPIERNKQNLITAQPDSITVGIPSQLLQNRTDIRKAEMALYAAKLDVKAARAMFYPTLALSANTGNQAINAAYFIKSPQSLLYNLAGELAAPLLNRSAIKANYLTTNAKQTQAIVNYERCILSAYIEVKNQYSSIANLQQIFEYKIKQVNALTQSIDISTGLFRNARADYMEVLLTQRDALDSKFELIDTRKQQFDAVIKMYRALGGGWR